MNKYVIIARARKSSLIGNNYESRKSIFLNQSKIVTAKCEELGFIREDDLCKEKKHFETVENTLRKMFSVFYAILNLWNHWNWNRNIPPIKDSSVLAVIAARDVLKNRKTRSFSTDSGVTCQLTHFKSEEFKKLAKKDIEEKFLLGAKAILKAKLKTIAFVTLAMILLPLAFKMYAKVKRKLRAISADVPPDPKLGVIRLDYDYPPIPGDVDCPDSFSYDVVYRTVPGFTFEMAQSGRMSIEVEDEFVDAVKWLNAQAVTAITGDCGFMMYFQELATHYTKVPVFMSTLIQLPFVTAAFGEKDQIAVFTANLTSLKPMQPLIENMMPKIEQGKRIVLVGVQDVDGFEAVALGELVDYKKVEPGIVKLAKETLKQHPRLKAFLFECTELSAYSDSIREATGLPVFDIITTSDFVINSFRDNPRFGINDWHNEWDGPNSYTFGENLNYFQRKKLVKNKNNN